MKHLTFIFLFTCSIFYSIGQEDSLRYESISAYLELEKFDDQHTFYVDTIVSVQDFSFYGVTPFATGFSFGIIFLGDSIVECEGFPNGMNKVPFLFELQSAQNGDYVSCIVYSDGTSQSSLSWHVLRVAGNRVEQVFAGTIYALDKTDPTNCEYNCFEFSANGDRDLIIESNNCADQAMDIARNFDLALDILANEREIETIAHELK